MYGYIYHEWVFFIKFAMDPKMFFIFFFSKNCLPSRPTFLHILTKGLTYSMIIWCWDDIFLKTTTRATYSKSWFYIYILQIEYIPIANSNLVFDA